MLEKIKNFFKRLWERFERVSKEVATPVAPTPVAPPVEAPKPVSGDSKPWDPRTANPGLGAWLGSDAVKPVDYGPPAGGTTVDRTGFVLSKGSPKVNMLNAGKTYLFAIPNTKAGEKVRVRVLEVTGTLDVFTSSWIVAEGALISPEKSYNRHGGFHEVVSPGGNLTLCLEITGSCPYGVEWV